MATNVALTGLARDMQARADTGRPIRIGLIGGGTGFINLLPGQQFVLTTEDVPGSEERVSVSLKTLPREVQTGHRILLADGNIEMIVERKLIQPTNAS